MYNKEQEDEATGLVLKSHKGSGLIIIRDGPYTDTNAMAKPLHFTSRREMREFAKRNDLHFR